MKVGKHTDLQTLAAEIVRRSNAKRDFLAKTPDVQVAPATAGGVTIQIGEQSMPINNIAHAQIAAHADIPKPYYDRMLQEQPELLARNVNTWFNAKPATRMIRTLDGTARAFLSDRARRDLENEDLATVALPIVKELGLEVMSAEITERRFYMKLVDQSVVRELDAIGGKFGDGNHKIVRMLSPALTLSNSEVGHGAMSILGGVYDGFCSNLATFGERSVRKYHAGVRHELVGEEVYALLSDDTKAKTTAATMAQVKDVIRAAFDRAKFDALCTKITATREDKIGTDADVVKVVELATRKLDLLESEGKSILNHLIEGGDLSRFGLYNAVTRMSQDVEDYDRATELERAGGRLIELPKTEWAELAKAA